MPAHPTESENSAKAASCNEPSAPLPPRTSQPPEWMAQPEPPKKRDWSAPVAVLLVAIVLAAAAIIVI